MTTDGIRDTDAPPRSFHSGGDQWSNSPASSSAAPATGADPSRIESLLHSLVTRLEENDQRYDAALNSLENRLNDMSAHAGVARPDSVADRLDRVAEQDENLARLGRVPEADQRPPITPDTLEEIENRITRFAARTQQGGPAAPGAEIEHTPPAGRPVTVGDLDARMDELARNLENALNTRPDDASLRAIESQLAHLSDQVAKGQQQYSRVETIESNLARLMEWAQSQGSQIETAAIKAAQETARHSANDAAGIADRYDWIHQELRVLNERSREMDERTGNTLQSMNAALQSLAEQARTDGNAEPAPAMPEPPAMPEMTASSAPVSPPPPTLDANRNAVGASIPDYQEPPPRPAQQSTLDAATSYRPGKDEAAFDDDDFLASARRAAEAAATRPGTTSERSGPFSRFRRGGANRVSASLGAGRSRPVLVTATIIFLGISAALLYGQLKNRVAGPVAITPGTTSPAAPSAKPSRFDTRLPETTVDKDVSKLPTEQPRDDRSVGKRAPLVSQPSDSQTDKRITHQPAARTAKQASKAPTAAGTEPKLASLRRAPVEPRYPGVSLTTAEPDPAPARKQTMAPLVPAGPAIPVKPAPKAQTISRAETTPHPPAATKMLPASPKSRSPMPPASIGPQSLRLAAAGGNREAQFEVASRYATGNGVKRDPTRASQWYARAAAQGLAPAQYRLAALYERGQGLDKDLALARVWYERAAKQGNVRAMHNLAVMLTGTGRRPDYANAAKWYAQAARYGLADSQFNLGVLYESGLGTKKSPLQAYQWFSLASARGDAQAEKRKQSVRRTLSPDGIRTADRTVRLWRARPIDKSVNEVRPPKGGWRSVVGSAGSAPDRSLVSRAQALLNKLGYDAGVPDGVLGSQTVNAIRRFQSKNGTQVSGRVTPALISQLKALAG